MEFRQLEYFIAVCKELHFTKAADKLGVSQPTLSLQIKALENETGMPLFDRIGKKIAMTEAGSLLLEQGVQIVRHLQNAKDGITELQNGRRGTLIIGTLPSDLDYRIADLLIDFHAEFPQVELRVIDSVEITEQVLNNEVDIGIGIMTPPDERLVQIPVCEESYVAVVSEDHEGAGRDSITLSELRGLRTVMFPKGYIGRELVDDCCREQGFELETIMETTSVASIIQLVKANVGATIQLHALIKSMQESGLRCIRIEGDAVPARHIEIIHRVDRFLGRAAQAFIQKTIDHFKMGV